MQPPRGKEAGVGPRMTAWKPRVPGALETHSGPEELKRQRQPVNECPPGHGFVYPALLKSEPTFFMVLNDSECFSLGRAAFHTRAYD